MPDRLHKLIRLSEGASTGDGEMIKFVVETETAAPFAIELESESIADLIQYLAYLSIDAAEKRGGDAPLAEKPPKYFAPFPASDIGLALSNTPGSVIFVVRVGGLDFGFECPAEQLKQSLASPAFSQSIDLLGSPTKLSH